MEYHIFDMNKKTVDRFDYNTRAASFSFFIFQHFIKNIKYE